MHRHVRADRAVTAAPVKRANSFALLNQMSILFTYVS